MRARIGARNLLYVLLFRTISLSVLVVTSLFLSLLWLSVQNAGPLGPGIIYVDDDNISGIEDGTLQYPYNTIQEGVDAAADGDTVFVFNGIYFENVLAS